MSNPLQLTKTQVVAHVIRKCIVSFVAYRILWRIVRATRIDLYVKFKYKNIYTYLYHVSYLVGINLLPCKPLLQNTQNYDRRRQ